MTGKERIEAVLKGEWPDKRPVMLHNFMMVAREAGITMKEYRSNPQSAARAHIEAVEKYGLDGVLFDIDTATLAAAAGVPVDYPLDEPARCSGPALNVIEEIDDREAVDISKNEYVQVWLESCRIIKNYFGDEILVRGNCDQAPFSLASMMRSPEEWMMDLLMDEDYVFKLLDYCTDISQQFIRLMVETGVDMVSNGDSPAGPDMISPEMYRKFAVPYEKRLVETAHELNMPYLLHICGNTDTILQDMVETGLDALELDYKTDIKKVYEVCKDKVVLFGNIDPSGIIGLGMPEQVEAHVKELLAIYKDSPRIVVNAGCAIPAFTPPENIKRLVEVTRNDY